MISSSSSAPIQPRILPFSTTNAGGEERQTSYEDSSGASLSIFVFNSSPLQFGTSHLAEEIAAETERDGEEERGRQITSGQSGR